MAPQWLHNAEILPVRRVSTGNKNHDGIAPTCSKFGSSDCALGGEFRNSIIVGTVVHLLDCNLGNFFPFSISQIGTHQYSLKDIAWAPLSISWSIRRGKVSVSTVSPLPLNGVTASNDPAKFCILHLQTLLLLSFFAQC